ncbi:MAG: crossover junction endodeoxyribonuclease RuvC [Hellea sp.]|nr:crossover junction endodeoxyribonuclease RuvC [Hellea sp.]
MNGIRIIGLDPSLVACGWGVIEMEGTKLRHIAHGVIRPNSKAELSDRLKAIFEAITRIIEMHGPHEASVELAFMKNNADSALKLGQARAACLLAASLSGLAIGEYSARSVKKSVVGTGKADKHQVAHMMKVLMPGCGVKAGDAADALAIAICHGHRVNAAGSLYRRSA